MVRLTRLCLRHPFVAFLLLAAVSLFHAAGALRLSTDAGFRSYLGARHPSVQQLDRFIERFGGGLPAAVVWSCREESQCRSIFDSRSLRMAYELASSLEGLPGVSRVESPATSALLVPGEAGLSVRRFVENGKIAPDRHELVRWALDDPLWSRRLVSSDGRVGAIVVQLASSDSETNSGVVGAMRELVAGRSSNAFSFALVGQPVGFVLAAEDLESDARRLVPAMMGIIWLVVFVLFGSVRLALATLACVSLALLWTLGTAGWMAWPQTAVSQALGPFVLVIGVCDGIHLLSRLANRWGASESTASRGPELVAASQELALPCLLTSLTTAGGFLSFVGAGIESFSHFGVLAALGVGYALLLTFSLLPLLLLAMPRAHPRANAHSVRWDLLLASGFEWVRGRRSVVAWSGVIAMLLIGSGLRELRIDVDLFQVFGENSRVVRWLRFAERHLAAGSAIEVEVSSPEGSIYEDAGLRSALRDATRSLEEVDGIQQAFSILDLTSYLGKTLESPSSEDDSHTPSDPELLFLIGLEDPGLLATWMSLDGRVLRISAQARQYSIARAEAVLRDTRAKLRTALPEHRFTLTGSFPVQYDMFTEVQRLQIRSFAIAWGVIFILLSLALRSLRLGALGMVPTTAPVLVTLGAMGFWGINLDIGTAMVGAVILGIAVDDTIHLLVEYRRRRRARAPRAEAIRGAVLSVGRALVTTSVALTLGFLTMTLSSWESVASFGLLSAIAIVVALVADLLLLPALILVGSALGAGRQAAQTPSR